MPRMVGTLNRSYSFNFAGDMNAIVQGLLAFNSLQTGGATPQYLVVTVRNADNAIVGGLVGATYLGWLQVPALWLPEELRGRGVRQQCLTRGG
jgi:hypothetical protein